MPVIFRCRKCGHILLITSNANDVLWFFSYIWHCPKCKRTIYPETIPLKELIANIRIAAAERTLVSETDLQDSVSESMPGSQE